MSLEARLRGIPDLEVRQDEPLSAHTSFRIGGPADWLALPHSVQALQATVRAAHETGTPLTILGSGTNVLVRDGGVRGMVLRLAENLAAIRVQGEEIDAEAGALMRDVAEAAARHGLGGLEFACGIPGSLGGAVRMNAGAYGGEMKDVVRWVDVVDENADLRRLGCDQMQFAYRRSILSETHAIVASAGLGLAPADPEAVRTRMAELQAQREARQPLDLPSAGSVFKRPPGQYAGKLIEDAGCKGLQVGQAQVSPKHAGFVVNLGGATAADVLELIRQVQARVAANSGVTLELEIRVIGDL